MPERLVSNNILVRSLKPREQRHLLPGFSNISEPEAVRGALLRYVNS
jgi:hypothetical protein